MFRLLKATLGLFLFFASSLHADPLLQDMNGPLFKLKDLRGKWVFINYWASWCKPCLHEIPILNQFYEMNRHHNLALFAVNYEGLPNEAQLELIHRFQIQYPSLAYDPADPLRLGEIRGVPVTFIFNPQGQLRHTLFGEQTKETLQSFLTERTLRNHG